MTAANLLDPPGRVKAHAAGGFGAYITRLAPPGGGEAMDWSCVALVSAARSLALLIALLLEEQG